MRDRQREEGRWGGLDRVKQMGSKKIAQKSNSHVVVPLGMGLSIWRNNLAAPQVAYCWGYTKPK